MTYDRQIARAEKAGLRAYREGVLAGANGRVLEIGGGTGANLRFYGPAVESLTLTEPETPMLRRLERKVRTQAPAATVLRAPAEDLPFDDDTFDVAVSTLVLCGVDDQPRAERAYPHNLVHYNTLDRGGHFAAWEQPDLFSAEMRAAFRTLR
jgi:ubiquinone/menaquinone biosynthesis C-methylase UbiE